ncbi:MAG: hypothetical protein OXF56_00325, partial [Rhodobacteraceae bacterium]|nr:hypothetical protein [Paracoccaceae bacterium]
MTNPRNVFLNPATPKMRRYEALCARYVDGCSTAEAARRFGYSHGSFRNLCSAFLDNPDWGFFEPRQPDPDESPPRPAKALRDGRILELRDQRALSV